MNRLTEALALLRAVKISPSTSVRVAFSPALRVQGTDCGNIYLHLAWHYGIGELELLETELLWNQQNTICYKSTGIKINL